MRTREQEVEPLINLSEITEVELIILKRMREFTIGEHASMFHGTGFDYVGLRDWQAGDRFENIDWPQSSLNNFSPLIVRRRDEVYPEDIQDLAQYVLGHRLWLGPHAASHGLTTDAVIKDVIEKTPIP